MVYAHKLTRNRELYKRLLRLRCRSRWCRRVDIDRKRSLPVFLCLQSRPSVSLLQLHDNWVHCTTSFLPVVILTSASNEDKFYSSVCHSFHWNLLSCWKLNPLKGRTVKCYTLPSRSKLHWKFWHLDTLALRAERQSARMSEINNAGYT